MHYPQPLYQATPAKGWLPWREKHPLGDVTPPPPAVKSPPVHAFPSALGSPQMVGATVGGVPPLLSYPSQRERTKDGAGLG